MNIRKEVYAKLQKLTKTKFNDDSDVFDIGIDSLDLVELITDVEDEFKISIFDEELAKIKYVKDIINAFKKSGS